MIEMTSKNTIEIQRCDYAWENAAENEYSKKTKKTTDFQENEGDFVKRLDILTLCKDDIESVRNLPQGL